MLMATPLHLFSHMTVFSGLDLLINGTCVSSVGSNWPYASYIKMLLSTSAQQKEQQLNLLTNFDTDTPPNQSSTGVSNKGREARKGRTFASKLLATYGVIPIDLLSCPKLIVPNCDLG